MKKFFAVASIAAISFSAPSLRADLLGTKVSGSLTFNGGATNYFDPSRGFVPAGFGNSVSPDNVSIGPGVEFGYHDIFNLDTANFSANRLVIRDVCDFAGTGICLFGSSAFQMKFTDLAFTSAALQSNALGVAFSFAGDALTISFPGGGIENDNATASFLIGSAAQTPEPGTMALVGTGLLGAAGVIRRRFVA